MPAEPEITTLQQLFPYLLAAITIIISASAYYIRDALRERSRVIKEKNNLDVAKQQMELKLNAQEIAYKRDLQETITRLNERLARMQERYQTAINQEVKARKLLEKRLAEIEGRYKDELQALRDENRSLKRENRRLREELAQDVKPNAQPNVQPNKKPNDSL